MLRMVPVEQVPLYWPGIAGEVERILASTDHDLADVYAGLAAGATTLWFAHAECGTVKGFCITHPYAIGPVTCLNVFVAHSKCHEVLKEAFSHLRLFARDMGLSKISYRTEGNPKAFERLSRSMGFSRSFTEFQMETGV